MSEEPHVLAEVADGIGWLTLNRPDARNANSPQIVELLIEHTAAFERNPEVRCVVLRSNGSHFMSGGDVRGFYRSLVEERERHLASYEMRIVKTHQYIYQIRRMPKPVLVSVQGPAAGIGVSLILAADLAIVICPHQSGPSTILVWPLKERENGQETRA